MIPTWMKIAIAYTAGIGTLIVLQNLEVNQDLGELIVMSKDIPEIGTDSMTLACACENKDRYDVTPEERAENFPVDNEETCREMVNGSATPNPEAKKGAWFSKTTLDLMFCNAPTANGIFVYKAKLVGEENEEIFLIEAARTNKIKTEYDGSSYIYYSRTLCPDICGRCGE